MERHVANPFALCKGPLVHEAPLASVRLIKNTVDQEMERVQFMGLMSFDTIWFGGRRATPINMLNGGVPFLGINEMSEH
jgi:hypothetical protein